MNTQQIFDHVCEHLVKQGERSERGSRCMYRGSNGLKCAVGCLIPDEDYDPEMDEGHFVEDLIENFRLPKYIGENLDLLRELQSVHDDWTPPDWKSSLRQIANDFNLTIPDCILEDRT